MPEKAKRRGRPTKPPVAGERVPLSLRVTADAKQRLEASAEQNGRSLSQEAEVRLEQSFRDDDLLPQLLAVAYGERLAGILMMIGSAMLDTGRRAGFDVTSTLEGSQGWADYPWPYQQARTAAGRILEALRPEGDPIAPPAYSGAGAPAALENRAENFGAGVANAYLNAAADTAASGELKRWSGPVRKLLGPEMLERLESRVTGRQPGKRGSK